MGNTSQEKMVRFVRKDKRPGIHSTNALHLDKPIIIKDRKFYETSDPKYIGILKKDPCLEIFKSSSQELNTKMQMTPDLIKVKQEKEVERRKNESNQNGPPVNSAN